MNLSLTMVLTFRPSTMSFFPLKPSPFPCSKRTKMSLNLSTNASSETTNRKLPVLLFDIMDTIVRDPFYHDVPAFFGMSLKDLIDCKHPTAWSEFEKGMIDEVELARIFFKDGRSFDLEGLQSLFPLPKRFEIFNSLRLAWVREVASSAVAGLKDCMRRGYSYLEGIEELLHALKQSNYEIHAFTNYPIWYKMIEDKLKISRYLSWTFCSCIFGKRKPDPDFYSEVLSNLKVDPTNCIFIDDRLRNVEAARELGIVGLHFKNTDSLRQDLSLSGIEISIDEHRQLQDKPNLATECSS